MPYREAEVEEHPCHVCDVRTAAGVGCLRCDMVLCERHRPPADERCTACEREWEHDARKIRRAARDYEDRRVALFTPPPEGSRNIHFGSSKERWLHRHPLFSLTAIGGLVAATAVLNNPLPLIAAMFLVEYPILGRWQNPRKKVDTARRAFLAERHVRLLKSPGGSKG